MKSPDAKLLAALESVIDPEMYISIVDLGLVYDVQKKKDGSIAVVMTLTTIGCPLFHVIQKEIEQVLEPFAGKSGVTIELTFDPPWNVDRMTEKGKAMLGI